MLNNPEMKEVVNDFCRESLGLCNELETILEDYEDNPQDTPLLEKYGQVIDRIMGAAKSLEANKIGYYSELGKTIAYKASQSQEIELLHIVTAVLFDTTDILKNLITSLKTTGEESVKEFNTEVFATRLKWLSEKFTDITRSSVAIEKKKVESNNMDQASIDDLLKELGL